MERENFYETIDDITADAGIRVRANSLEDLICKTLLATFNEITDIDRVQPSEVYEIHVEGSMPFLLADLINEALVIHESKKFVASRCEVLEADNRRVSVRIHGERFNPSKHTSKLLIKAATYHRLNVREEEELYVAEVIFDI